jgi:uncharacterized membrane protein YedE/YeeE
MFEEPVRLLLGLLTGIVFGFLLQKGRVAKYEVILGQFLLRDWTVLKIMLTAVAVGAVGIYAMTALAWTTLQVKPLQVGGIIIGAILFGIGMAVLGYCPGTTVAACGEGRRDAMAGLVGMLVGAAVYVLAWPVLRRLIGAGGNFGKITMPEISHVSPWLWIGILVLAVLVLRVLIARRYERSHPDGSVTGTPPQMA